MVDMQLQLIRNATLRLTYANHLILIDPYFAPKHSLPSFIGKSPNPTVDLPLEPAAIMQDIEAILVSHLHTDHFDAVAKDLLPKDLPLFCQPGDEGKIAEAGFTNVQPIAHTLVWNDITLTRTPGSHGRGKVVDLMGQVSGFVFKAAGEPSLYWAGDTVWYEEPQAVVAAHQPDVIVSHSCGAVWQDMGIIVMDAAETVALCQAAPYATIIATHMEALDHATITRQNLRSVATDHGISEDQLLIPDDGETVSIFNV